MQLIMIQIFESVMSLITKVELAWRSRSIMDCHAMARGSNPGGYGLFAELHVLHKGQ